MCAIGKWLQKCPQCNIDVRYGRDDPKICGDAEKNGQGIVGSCKKGMKNVKAYVTGHYQFRLCSEACWRKAVAKKAGKAKSQLSDTRSGPVSKKRETQ
ncbi:hypothetical protein O9K51_08934 [Purpureocillium lavendulum]|uniref:Uncharacterized protein n=1 Tax=Purpureocillium lavendulum TaxID=1247861 RepID=A0AB34FH89_9HYPO|nr:hypothetical protein O9K51_08934 [Purpureocillium lavendulum]